MLIRYYWASIEFHVGILKIASLRRRSYITLILYILITFRYNIKRDARWIIGIELLETVNRCTPYHSASLVWVRRFCTLLWQRAVVSLSTLLRASRSTSTGTSPRAHYYHRSRKSILTFYISSKDLLMIDVRTLYALERHRLARQYA